MKKNDDYETALENLLADLFSAAREYHGWNDSEIAEQSGITASTISRWSNRKVRFPRLDTVWKFATAVGMSFELVRPGEFELDVAA